METPLPEGKQQKVHSSRHFARLADIFREKGELDRAIEILTKGLDEHPDYLTARIILAACFTDRGDVERALEEYATILRVDPFHTAAMKKMSRLLVQQGRREEAREFIMNYLEEVPDDTDIRELLEGLDVVVPVAEEPAHEDTGETPDTGSANATDENGHTQEAEKVIEDEEHGKEAAPGGDDELIATMTLAEIYASQGFYEKAIEIYTKVLMREPSNEMARKRIEAIRRGEIDRVPEAADGKGLDHSESAEKSAGWEGGSAPGEVVVDEEYEKFRKWLTNLTRKKDTRKNDG